MDKNTLMRNWLKEEEMSFKGWDFSYLDNRWEDEKSPWDYNEIISNYLKADHKLLDMGTGGGEFLLKLNHPYKNTTVTEAYEPNVELCKERLSPLGIKVVQVYDDNILPFQDNSFDIIINRHESYDITEVKRILKPNGIFITQQVGGKNNEVLSNYLIDNFKSEYEGFSLGNESKNINGIGLKIIYSNEFHPYLRFYDVGAIIYYAKIIEWEFPGFNVKECFDKLYNLEKELQTKSYIETFEHRFIFVCINNNQK